MKAVRIHTFGGPDALSVEWLDLPALKPGELLVKIGGAGINPVDAKIREGKFSRITQKQLPITLGRDICGTVENSNGDSVFALGTPVFALLDWSLGGYAEHVAVAASLCVRKPQSLGVLECAAIPLAGLTAWQGLFEHGQLEKDQSVLIHGGAGGVGHLAVQFALARGAHVITTVSTKDVEFATSLGADTVIDYKTQKFEDIAKDVDVVLDLIGGETRQRSWQVIKPGGMLVSTLGQPDEQLAAQHGVRACGYVTHPDASQLSEISRLIDAGEVRPTLTKYFALDDAAEAHRYLEKQHPRGKTVFFIEDRTTPAPA